MRIRTINMKGYGRFSEKTIQFAPGLQIVVGPNERGKSTIRAFIADMLFGQKVNDTQRVFEESNELRKPWTETGEYGGSLEYDLDDGSSFEVVRNFDKDHDSISVIDRASGEDVTGQFERFRNRELDFARKHLGLSKEVFLNAATISHVSLDDLGDNEALDQIREKILALTDSGGGSGTVEGAMRLLSERVAAIGTSGAKNKPLAQARKTLHALELEYQEVLERRDATTTLALERKSLVEHCQALRKERKAAEAALRTLERHDEQARLAEARQLQASIDEATQQCLALSHVREIPMDRDAEMRANEDAVRAAERQLELTESQKHTLLERLKAETGSEGGVLTQTAPEFPAALEQRLNEIQATRAQRAERILETEALVKAAKDRMEEVQRQLTELPDFSRLAADPVEWLSQLASSFAVALRARNEECSLRETLQQEVASLIKKNAPYAELFHGREDFPELAREYALQLRLHESQKEQHAGTLHTLQGTFAELQGESRAFLPIGGACFGVALITGYLHFFTEFGDTMVIALVASVVGIIFLAMWATQRSHMRRLADRIEDAREAVDSVAKASGNLSLTAIDDMLRASNSSSIRELEALHDQFRTIEMELKLRREALVSQEEKAEEAEERIPLLLERFRETFLKAGEEIANENDVQDASGRAIARYQEYRETKRRSSTNRSVQERHESELKRLRTLAAQADGEWESLEAEAREFVTQHGLADSGSYETVQEAIVAYRNAFAQNREIRGRQDLLGENLRDLERQVDRERKGLEECRAKRSAAFKPFGINSMDGWSDLMTEAVTYQQRAEERRKLEDELSAKLGKDSLASLGARVEAAGELESRPETTREALRETIDALNDVLETETDREHALHLKLTAQSNGVRPVNELEEEQAVLRNKIRALEAEGDATSYAMALIEDVARDTHAYMAPRLAEEASQILKKITAGTYNEISLGRDLSVRIRIPETQRLHDAPEKSLSKGTVDQIYLALRLAFVQSLNASGEGIPMLLDDPFANYDDARLAMTMGLISDLVGRNQVVLFTCREDVVAAAEAHHAAIIRL